MCGKLVNTIVNDDTVDHKNSAHGHFHQGSSYTVQHDSNQARDTEIKDLHRIQVAWCSVQYALPL